VDGDRNRPRERNWTAFYPPRSVLRA
jgi:hypothetical protein